MLSPHFIISFLSLGFSVYWILVVTTVSRYPGQASWGEGLPRLVSRLAG